MKIYEIPHQRSAKRRRAILRRTFKRAIFAVSKSREIHLAAANCSLDQFKIVVTTSASNFLSIMNPFRREQIQFPETVAGVGGALGAFGAGASGSTPRHPTGRPRTASFTERKSTTYIN